MKSISTFAAVMALALASVTAARADLIVQKDGTVVEGKITARNAQGLTVQLDGAASKAPLQLPVDKIDRVIQVDDHGAELAEAEGVKLPVQRPAPHWSVPAEPTPPPVVASKDPTYYLIPLHGAVGETYLADILEKSLADAQKRKPAVVVLDINSPGGLVSEAELMVKTLHKYNKDMRIVALADQDLSASAITSLSVRSIYMKSTGTFGAATAFDTNIMGTPTDIQEKFQSAWRAVARNSAEEGGHEPLLADAMIDNTMALHLETVDGKKVVKEGPGSDMLTRPGKILTLTSHEAVKCGLAVDIADDLNELGEELNLKGWKECPGLGTLLADYIPKRRDAFEQKEKEIAVDFKENLTAAEDAAPSEGPVMQHVFIGPDGLGGMGGRSPRIMIQQNRELLPAQIAQWNSHSLAAVVAFQKMEQDIQDEIALANAFGQEGAAEELKEPLAALIETRAQLYSERNKYANDPRGITAGAAPALVLKNAPLPAKLSNIIKQAVDKKNYGPAQSSPSGLPKEAAEDIAPDGGVLIGLRCGMDNFAEKEVITSLQPVYLTAKGAVMGKVYGNVNASPVIDLIAKDGYAVEGAKVENWLRCITGIQLHFVRIADGGLSLTDSYDSNTAGNLDNPVTMGNAMPVVGILRNGLGITSGFDSLKCLNELYRKVGPATR